MVENGRPRVRCGEVRVDRVGERKERADIDLVQLLRAAPCLEHSVIVYGQQIGVNLCLLSLLMNNMDVCWGRARVRESHAHPSTFVLQP